MQVGFLSVYALADFSDGKGRVVLSLLGQGHKKKQILRGSVPKEF